MILSQSDVKHALFTLDSLYEVGLIKDIPIGETVYAIDPFHTPSIVAVTVNADNRKEISKNMGLTYVATRAEAEDAINQSFGRTNDKYWRDLAAKYGNKLYDVLDQVFVINNPYLYNDILSMHKEDLCNDGCRNTN